VEYAQNIVFKRNRPIHSIFERSCDLGLARITTQRIANIFGWRITKRTKGKHQVVLDQMDHGHHVLRAYSKNALVKQYEKDNTFLRIETCSNNLKDFRQKKALEHLPEVAEKLQAVNDRFADAQAENLNVQIDYPLLEKLAQPRRLRSQRMAGIRLENDRIIRLLEILMHSSAHFNGLSATDLHQAVLDAHHITASQYTRNQLAYDLRKLRAQYRRTTRSFNDLIALLKAA